LTDAAMLRRDAMWASPSTHGSRGARSAANRGYADIVAASEFVETLTARETVLLTVPMYQPYDRKEFAPWRAEFRLMIFYWLIGAMWFGAAIVWCVRDPRPESIGIAEGAVLPFFFGFLYLDSANRRRHGSLVEKQAVKRFISAAPSVWFIEADLVLRKFGNIDLLVRFPDGRQCPIEIKSWRSAGSLSRRTRALEQVRRQCEALRARNGVVWLPKAIKKNILVSGDLLLVEGNEHFLIRRLADLARNPAEQAGACQNRTPH
jgi:hypothetical protein